ncbi:hypothetical protein SCHPADRAFT_941241 [Schizopora paradoxa]|uniref:Uncharacterized protein n=1 Tax=Schizopora paradoxa TaxID=27342 RepID=A0A0H2RLH8_9AGAM|nr:hypothetical protein SCHPADRAFT_941241 [Schizopora paradoxa]
MEYYGDYFDETLQLFNTISNSSHQFSVTVNGYRERNKNEYYVIVSITDALSPSNPTALETHSYPDMDTAALMGLLDCYKWFQQRATASASAQGNAYAQALIYFQRNLTFQRLVAGMSQPRQQQQPNYRQQQWQLQR